MLAWLTEIACGMSGRHRDGSPSLMWDRDKETGQRILRCPNCFKIVGWWGGKPKRKKKTEGKCAQAE